jgi:hypothetical protein
MSRWQRTWWPYVASDEASGGGRVICSHLLGASIRMGAVIPRYNLEKLPDVNPACSFPPVRGDGIPFILDDLPEAVDHAIITLVTNDLASLELSVYV